MYKLLMTWIWGEGGTWQLVDKTGMFVMTQFSMLGRICVSTKGRWEYALKSEGSMAMSGLGCSVRASLVVV